MPFHNTDFLSVMKFTLLTDFIPGQYMHLAIWFFADWLQKMIRIALYIGKSLKLDFMLNC